MSNSYAFAGEKEEDEGSLLQDLNNLTIDSVRKMREKNRSKFVASDNTMSGTQIGRLERSNSRHHRSNKNLDDGVVDVFTMMVSHGFYDRQFLNSIKQLRQFNDTNKKLPKNIQ